MQQGNNIEDMKRPSSLLGILITRTPTRLLPLPVSPWPAHSAFDKWLSSEFDKLRLRPECYTSASWHLKALEVALATQKMVTRSITTIDSCSIDVNRKMVDNYLDDVVELLDMCKRLKERMETIRKYTNVLAVALHWLEGDHEPCNAALGRAKTALDSCAREEKRCGELEKCGSRLRKLGETRLGRDGMRTHEAEFWEALSGSKAVALLVVGMVGIGLSFKSKWGLPMVQPCKVTSWLSSLHGLHKEVKEEFDDKRRRNGAVLDELNSAVAASRSLQGLISRLDDGKALRCGELKAAVEGLRRRCGELEEGVKPFEGRVDELYMELISIRMSLLGMFT